MNPFILKDRLITALQVFFSNDSDYTWNEDQEQSKVVIADIYGIDRKDVEKYPIVAVGRGQMGIQRPGIGSRESIQWAAQDSPQPKETFANLVTGEMVCSCISTVGIESERLAMMIANFLEMTRHELRPILKLLRLDDIRIGKELRLKDWPGQIDTPVMFNYIYPVRWTVTDKSVLMKKIALTLNK